MKAPLAALALMAACSLAQGQEPPSAAAQRSRIADERGKAQAQFATDEKACYGKFAVNDCLNEARARRRASLATLRSEEIALNDLERRRRSSERLESLDQRASEAREKQADDRRAAALAAQAGRDARAAAKATAPKPGAAARTPRTATPHGPGEANTKTQRAPKSIDAAGNAQHYRERMQQAQEHREQVARRASERRKDGVKPLPVPP